MLFTQKMVTLGLLNSTLVNITVGGEKMYVDWPLYVKRHEYPTEIMLHIRNDGSLVCLNLCPYNYECPDQAEKEPYCAWKAVEFEVPTVWSHPVWRSPRKVFVSWKEAVEFARELGEQLLKERVQQ